MDLEIDRRESEDPARSRAESSPPAHDEPEVSGSGSSLLDRARAYALKTISELNLMWAGSLELAADSRVVETAPGERIVHLRQLVHGVPVFQAFCSVRFDAEERPLGMVGGGTPYPDKGVDLEPALDAADAVQIAAHHLAAPGGNTAKGLPGLVVSNRRPRIVGSFPVPGSPTLVSKPPFAKPTRAHLVLFHEPPRLRLGWQIYLWLPKLFEQYDAVVSANGPAAGEILFCRSGIASSVRARATFVNPDLAPATLQDLPQQLTVFRPLAPRNLPGPWVVDKKTAGNNVESSWKSAKISAGGVPGGLVFDPAQPLEAAAVNAFFFCNYLHDFFYLLGFDEAAGALQRSNPSGIKGDKDALDVRIVGDAVPGDARIITEADGTSVLLQMGQITSPLDQVVRHTAFDAEVLIHEYTHAVTSRRVGHSKIWKPLLNGPPQARAMEEGMSDYFALTLGNHLRRRAGIPDNFAYGSWSCGDSANGRRRRSYAGFGEAYEDLPAHPEPHEAGMLWCAALLGMNRRLAALLGTQERADLAGWLLVFQAMPGIPIGSDAPSFLDGRDALGKTARSWRAKPPVVAAGPLGTPAEIARIEEAVDEAFAERGMGRNARSHEATLSGLFNDFTA